MQTCFPSSKIGRSKKQELRSKTSKTIRDQKQRNVEENYPN